MNLKPQKKEPWLNDSHLKLIAVYIALALVLVINQIVFSVVLKGREKVKAIGPIGFSNTFMASLFTPFAGGNVEAGTSNIPAAQFIIPNPWITDKPSQTCSWRTNDPGNVCLTSVDFDGTATGGAGVQTDGSTLAVLGWFPPGGNIGGIFFNGGDKLCTDSLTAPACVYVDSDADCNGGTGTQNYILGAGCAGGADTAVSGITNPLWLHTELVNNNNSYDYSATPGQSEAIWIYKLKADTVINGAQGTDWASAFPNQWQGDASGAWTAKDTFYDANADGKFDGSPLEPVYIDKDGDGLFTDTANLTYEADGTGSLGTGVSDDVIPDGATLNPLLPADNVCLNTLGQGGVGNVIIYVDGNGNCIPGDGGTDVLVRDDTGTGIGVGFGTFPHTYVSAAYILRYYDADSSGTWTHGNSAATTETLWARLQGLDQWHTNIEAATGPIEADGTATLGAGVDDDALANSAALTYLQTADNMCFSRHPITTALEDIYIDTSGDCIPGNGGLDTILQDISGDGLNPATTNGGWASGAGIFAYHDGSVGAPNGAWDWGAGAAATETLWIEVHGSTYASGPDANVYAYGSTPFAGSTLTQLSTATGPTGSNLIYANSDGSGTLTSANTILEDNGNVQTGAQNNSVIDRQDDVLQHITIKNIGTAVAGSDIASVDLYDGGPGAGGCDNPVGSVNDTFIGNLPATGPNTWEATGSFGPSVFNGRVCVSINLNLAAVTGRTITLQIPQFVDSNSNGLFDPGDAGLFVYSGNDGPNGGNVDLPYTFTIVARPSYGGRTQDTTPPGILTNVDLKADSSGTVIITWQDPSDSDLSQIAIDEASGGKTDTQNIDKGVQNLTLTGRQVGQEYNYTLRAEDTSGNFSPKQIYTITVPAQGQVEVTQPSGGQIMPSPIEPTQILPQSVSVGDLVKSQGKAAVYYVGADKKKHYFQNEIVYKTWFNDFTGLKTISEADLSMIADGKPVYMREGTYLVKKTGDPKVYAIEPGGILRWISSEQVARDLYGSKWASRVIDLSSDILGQYSSGEPILYYIHPNGSLISYSGSTKIYYIENDTKREVSNDVFSQSRFQDRFVAKGIATNIVYADGPALAALTEVGYLK